MAQWINVLQNNSFANPKNWNPSHSGTGSYGRLQAVRQAGRLAGWQAIKQIKML